MSKSNSNSTGAESPGSTACAELTAQPKPLQVQKTKLEKTQSMLSVISTSIGLLGIAGSVFAFALSTFYTGTVEVRPDFETPGLVVKVYTSEGHQSVFHAREINLMPGKYHLEITSPNGKVIHRDSKVSFHHKNVIDVKLGPPPADSVDSAQNSKNAGTNSDGSTAQPEANALNSADTPLSSSLLESTASAAEAASTGQSNSSDSENQSAEAQKKRRWWQFWKKSDKSGSENI